MPDDLATDVHPLTPHPNGQAGRRFVRRICCASIGHFDTGYAVASCHDSKTWAGPPKMEYRVIHFRYQQLRPLRIRAVCDPQSPGTSAARDSDHHRLCVASCKPLGVRWCSMTERSPTGRRPDLNNQVGQKDGTRPDIGDAEGPRVGGLHAAIRPPGECHRPIGFVRGPKQPDTASEQKDRRKHHDDVTPGLHFTEPDHA